MPSSSRRFAALAFGFGLLLMPQTRPAWSQEAHHYSFGYDQPHTTGYGIAGDLFAAKLGS